jgi:antitoxin YefM
MQAISYTQVRKNFAEAMNSVCESHNPIIITRQKSEPVVMLSLEDYNAIEETLYLLKSPKNAERLAKALQQIEDKKFLQKELIEE